MVKIILATTVLMTSLFNCGGTEKVNDSAACTKNATVRDLTGLDGCGIVFVLDDGTNLIPERRTYIQAPQSDEDPLYYWDLTPGEKVKIGYREVSSPNVCMAGPTVFITCITKIE